MEGRGLHTHLLRGRACLPSGCLQLDPSCRRTSGGCGTWLRARSRLAWATAWPRSRRVSGCLQGNGVQAAV
jgi:hypothetical protein